ncbi:MAG: putative metal-binding motif-containing protein, partial [Pseudomonadota bacterium]
MACSAPSGTTADATDCDDTDPAVNPGATEVCNGVDDDCSGTADEGVCLDISNVSPSFIGLGEAALAVTADSTLDTDTGAIAGLRAAGTGLVDGIWFETVTQSSGPDLGVFAVDGFSVASSATLTVTGSAALVIVSSADSEVAGRMDLTGEDGTDSYGTSGPNAGGLGVAGGADGGEGSDNHYAGATSGYGTGAGLVGYPGVHYGNGGGGAGHCWGGGGGMGGSSSAASAGSATAGGDGGGSSSEYGYYGGTGGDPYSSYRLEPLLAGSGGGGGLSDTDTNPNGGGGGGGGGGGALQLSVDGALAVSGTLDASGGEGGCAWGGAGGG